MKRFLLAVALLVWLAFIARLCAAAENVQPVSLQFAAVPLMTFTEATYKSLLARDYVVSAQLAGMDKRISVSVKAISAEKLPQFVDDLLLSNGITSTLRDGIYYLDLAAPPSQAVVGVAPPSGASKVPLSSVVEGASAPARQGVVDPLLAAPKHDGDKVAVYYPQNRPADFMVTVLDSAFGQGVARAAGSVVVVSAPAGKHEAIFDLADHLDQASRTVEVSASFVEVGTTKSNSQGLSLVANVLGQKLGVTLGAATGAFTISGSNFQMVLDALDADGRFKQVSNSRVVGDEAEKMSLSVGDETPTLSSSSRDNQGNPIQNIVYRSSGVLLDVLPKVLGSGRISINVDGQVSSFQTTVNGVSGSPTLVKRQVKTAVTVGDGDVLVIGGLEDTKRTDNRSGISFLPASWSSKQGSDARTDLVLILSAKVGK